MQQQDITGGETIRESAQHRIRVAAGAVISSPGPGHVAKRRASQYRMQKWAAQPHRRAKEPRSVAEGTLRVDHLPQKGARPMEREPTGVAVTVVLHAVAAPQDVGDQFRVGGGPPANAEEACLRAISVEQVQHERRHNRVRSVVEGQSHLATTGASLGQADKIGPQEAAARPQNEIGEDQMVARDRGEYPGPRGGNRDQGENASRMQADGEPHRQRE